ARGGRWRMAGTAASTGSAIPRSTRASDLRHPRPWVSAGRMAGCAPMARFGILTGGGDCPGLNAVIRGVVRAGVNRYGHSVLGFRYGWAGVIDSNIVELTPQSTAGILHRGGTILGSSRTNPYKDGADGTAAVRKVMEQ